MAEKMRSIAQPTEFAAEASTFETIIGSNLLDQTKADEFYRDSLVALEDAVFSLSDEKEIPPMIDEIKESIEEDLCELNVLLGNLSGEERLARLDQEKDLWMNISDITTHIEDNILRPQQEAAALSNYHEHSLENEELRKWNDSDVSGFGTYLASRISDQSSLDTLLRNNPLLWNPKGNPDLYVMQQCVETACIFLISYCYENGIDLALPSGEGYKALSNYDTVEAFMGDLYPNLASVHLFNDTGGLFKEVPQSQARAGDFLSISHEKGGGHVIVLTSSFGEGKYGCAKGFAGNQLDNRFRESEGQRADIERSYPKGYVDVQEGVPSDKIKMPTGGYGTPPEFTDMVTPLSARANMGDHAKILRINPAGMNRILGRINPRSIS